MRDKIEGELRWHGRVLDSTLKKLRLVCISDVHYGNPLCSVKHFMKAIMANRTVAKA